MPATVEHWQASAGTRGSALGIGLLVSFRSAVAADTTADQGSLSLTAWVIDAASRHTHVVRQPAANRLADNSHQRQLRLLPDLGQPDDAVDTQGSHHAHEQQRRGAALGDHERAADDHQREHDQPPL